MGLCPHPHLQRKLCLDFRLDTGMRLLYRFCFSKTVLCLCVNQTDIFLY
ncbi:hypothetical protein RHDC1_01091 [Rhodocyclaceae bacterium]|nr:hypothetical protein RHDC1_01091 [Rhodocyclaceae bacterium]